MKHERRRLRARSLLALLALYELRVKGEAVRPVRGQFAFFDTAFGWQRYPHCLQKLACLSCTPPVRIPETEGAK